jgi:hypothetical protein
MFGFDSAPELFGIFAEGPDGTEKHRVDGNSVFSFTMCCPFF